MTNKKPRIAAIIISVILVLTIIFGITVSTVNVSAANISPNAIYLFTPKELEAEFDGEKITFYLRKNAEYDSKKDSDIMNAFEVYYYDENGEEVNLGSTGQFESEEQTVNPLLLFLYQTMEKFTEFKSIVQKVVLTFVVLLIVALIIIWFIVDSRRMDEEKMKRNSNQKNKKKKK